MKKTFFLAKAGRTFGPYDQIEIESLRESGEYEKFSWFWDQRHAQWQPIDPPPAPPQIVQEPVAETAEAAPSRVRETPVTSNQSAPPQESHGSVSPRRLQSISALCYDHQNVVTGTLTHVTDAGCEFITRTPSSVPEFQSKLPILIHLFDQNTGRSMNVSGRMGHIERRDGSWHYRIHWKGCPELLRENGLNSAKEASLA